MWTHTEWTTHCNSVVNYFAANQAILQAALGRAVGMPMLPPPPRTTPTKLLFIGHSPKLLDDGFFGENAAQAFVRANNVRYVNGPNAGAANPQQVHPYYGPLVSLARCVHPGFGVWWQIDEARQAQLKVEFTDICHLPCANDDELRIIWDTNVVPNFKRQCLTWLQTEIIGIDPDIIVCNGTLASPSLRHLAGMNEPFNPSEDSPYFQAFGAWIHLSGFMTSARPLDQFNKARLAKEIREQM